MKRLLALVMLVSLAALSAARGQSLDDQYVQIFNVIQEADSMGNNQPAQALAKYVQAQTSLLRLQRGSPDWNPRIINFRLSYVASRISALSALAPAPKASAPPPTNPPPATLETTTPAPPPAKPAAPAGPTAPPDWDSQLNGLKDQVRQLQSDMGLLQNKLKESLSMQPAAVDPRELAKADERIKSLQKENDLLKVTLELERAKPALVANTAVLEKTRKDLEESTRQLALQKDLAARLAQDKAVLQARIAALSLDAEASAALRAENQLLKKQLADLKASPPPASKSDDAARQMAQARAQMAALQSDKEILRLEKLALENRVKQLSAKTLASMSPMRGSAADATRIKQLEQERDDLQKKLEVATKELSGRKGKAAAAHVEELESQLATARARLEIFEARQVPYTAEELALFKRPEPKFAEADARTGKKSIRELPAGSAKLIAEAQTFFSARQFDKAEQTYLQVVRQDQKSVPALANLAAIQVEDRHLEAAEINLKQALALDPDDAFSLSVLGNLKFRQGKFDDALDALSHAAKLDPQNPEIQNYLGLTLSEKGLRGPAETALRKAIQLQPDYASAHNNLAVIYITQNPPAVELARWHYQRALSAGHPHNLELEKLLDIKK